jgi:hypothetical protein
LIGNLLQLDPQNVIVRSTEIPPENIFLDGIPNPGVDFRRLTIHPIGDSMSLEEALAANTVALNANTAALSGGTAPVAKPAKKAATVAALAPEAAPTAPAAAAAPVVLAATSPDFKKTVEVFTQVAQKINRDAAKAILAKYGATQLSTMKIEHLPAFTADCTAALAPAVTPTPAGSDLI